PPLRSPRQRHCPGDGWPAARSDPLLPYPWVPSSFLPFTNIAPLFAIVRPFRRPLQAAPGFCVYLFAACRISCNDLCKSTLHFYALICYDRKRCFLKEGEFFHEKLYCPPVPDRAGQR